MFVSPNRSYDRFVIAIAKNGSRFTSQKSNSLLSAGLIMKAHGLAILTVAKIGFLVTARGGSGIVIAKLPGGGKTSVMFLLGN